MSASNDRKIVEMHADIAARSDLMQGYLDCWRKDKGRAERAEAYLAAARALLTEARVWLDDYAPDYAPTRMVEKIDTFLKIIDAALAGKDAT